MQVIRKDYMKTMNAILKSKLFHLKSKVISSNYKFYKLLILPNESSMTTQLVKESCCNLSTHASVMK